MFGVSLRDNICNEVIRQRSRVTDIAGKIRKLKSFRHQQMSTSDDGQWLVNSLSSKLFV